MPIRVSADDGGMTGEVFFAEFQAKCLCLFHGQAVVGCISGVKADDILVAFDITMLGVLAILAVCQQTGRCKREIATLKGVEQVRICDKHYLLYGLQSQFVQHQISWSEGTGTTVSNLRIPHLEQIRVPYVPLDQQKKISSVLYALEDKIENNRKLNDNLELQAQLIYSERFEGVKSNDLPSGWRVVPLGEIAMISNKNFNPLKESERILEHYSIPAFDETKFPIFEPSTSIKSNKFVVDSSCFLISKLNPTVKRVWKPYCLTGSAVCSTEFIVYKSKKSYITDFLYSVIDSNSFSDFMCSHVTGSTGSRQRTIPSDTLSYKVILPSEDELIRFQSLVSPIYSRIRNNAIENDRLKQLRNSLLPKLMSGEIDVSNIKI